MAMTLASMAQEASKDMKKDTPMKLKRMAIEPAEGGMIVRCDFEGHKNGEHQYKERVKVFEDSEDMAKFVAKAFKGYDGNVKDDDGEGGY